jgi:hypothetical protein
MLKGNTVFAQKILDFYAVKGVDCLVVHERQTLLITLAVEGRTREFRYGKRAFPGLQQPRKFYAALEREFCNLWTAPEPAACNQGTP